MSKLSGEPATNSAVSVAAENDVDMSPSMKAYERVFGYKTQVAGTEIYLALDDLKEIAQPGRADVVIDQARKELDTEKPVIIGVRASDALEDYPDLRDKMLAALDAAKAGKSSDSLAYDRGNVDREWTFYTTIELHPEKNAIIMRRAHSEDVWLDLTKDEILAGRKLGICQKAELSHNVGPVDAKHKCAFDDVGMFPRYTIGENKDVFAFKIVK